MILHLKKGLPIFIGIFFLLLSSGCNRNKEKNIVVNNGESVTLNNIEVATISKVNNSKKNIITNFATDESVKLVYEKNSITDDEYQKYVEYFYDQCYGFSTLAGLIKAEDGNYIEFVKKFDDKMITILINESIDGDDSQYSITYTIRDFNEDEDEIYYNKEIINIEDGKYVYSIISNDKCN